MSLEQLTPVDFHCQHLNPQWQNETNPACVMCVNTHHISLSLSRCSPSVLQSLVQTLEQLETETENENTGYSWLMLTQGNFVTLS